MLPHWQFASVQFCSRWYIRARENQYALRRVSQKFPQRWLWRSSVFYSQIALEVTLMIQDVNDEAPLLINLPYKVTISEVSLNQTETEKEHCWSMLLYCSHSVQYAESQMNDSRLRFGQLVKLLRFYFCLCCLRWNFCLFVVYVWTFLWHLFSVETFNNFKIMLFILIQNDWRIMKDKSTSLVS